MRGILAKELQPGKRAGSSPYGQAQRTIIEMQTIKMESSEPSKLDSKPMLDCY